MQLVVRRGLPHAWVDHRGLVNRKLESMQCVADLGEHWAAGTIMPWGTVRGGLLEFLH